MPCHVYVCTIQTNQPAFVAFTKVHVATTTGLLQHDVTVTSNRIHSTAVYKDLLHCISSLVTNFRQATIVMLENPVPNSCDVVRVTNNDSRSGNVYRSLYKHFVFYFYSANSQNFTSTQHLRQCR